MKKTFILLVISLVLTSGTIAQINQNLQDNFQSILEQYKSSAGVVGLSVAVKTDDGIWASAIGDNSATIPLDPQDNFPIASVSKTIISAVILQMQEDGLLSLDDSIGTYLDEYDNVNPEVTIRQLLNHTSGIYNVTSHPGFQDFIFNDLDSTYSREVVLAALLDEPLFAPGTDWSYSNTNYLLLGLIIESVSDNDYYYLVARERFSFDAEYPSFSVLPFESDPLLDLAHYWEDTTAAGNGPLLDIQALGWGWNSWLSTMSAAASFAANPTDLSRWAFDLYSGNLLNSSSMDALLTNSPPNVFGNVYGLGIQFTSTPCGQDVVGHDGVLAYKTKTIYDPENRISVSAHVNQFDNVVYSLAKELICAYNNYLTTSTEEVNAFESFEVYPNPTNGIVQLERIDTDNLEIRILNAIGNTMLNVPPSQNGTLNLTDLPRGMYFIELFNGKETGVKRIIKQ